MHEGAMMQAVVTTILDSVQTTPGGLVTRVQLELGTSHHFTEEAVRQYFQLLTRDTPAADAELEITWLPANYQCLMCLRSYESREATGICPQCGGISLETAHQEHCDLRKIEVVVPDA